MPDATPLTINLMGAIAQYERETVSKRTKRALAELKNRGVELGANNPKVKAGLEKYRDKQKYVFVLVLSKKINKLTGGDKCQTKK